MGFVLEFVVELAIPSVHVQSVDHDDFRVQVAEARAETIVDWASLFLEHATNDLLPVLKEDFLREKHRHMKALEFDVTPPTTAEWIGSLSLFLGSVQAPLLLARWCSCPLAPACQMSVTCEADRLRHACSSASEQCLKFGWWRLGGPTPWRKKQNTITSVAEVLRT